MKRLRWYDFLFINLFWFGMNIRNTAVGSFFMPYLVAQYAPSDWKNTALSAMSTAGLIIAMIVQPLAGLFSDRSTSRFGRRRPYIMVGTLLDLVFLVAIGLSWSYWSLLAAVLLIQFSANISHGPLQALDPRFSTGGPAWACLSDQSPIRTGANRSGWYHHRQDDWRRSAGLGDRYHRCFFIGHSIDYHGHRKGRSP